jgi:DNA-nicking Smr family endonuclease
VKRPLRAEDHRLWSMVAATVHPMPGRVVPSMAGVSGAAIDRNAPAARIDPTVSADASNKRQGPAQAIEPGRRHRIARERDPIGAHIDLHGLSQDQARAALEGFVLRSWNEGMRAVLVITGKGLRGDGILRRMTPEWLAAPRLRAVVAGISESHRRHGGEGALYIALKRRARS